MSGLTKLEEVTADKLGRMVREVWVTWAREQPNPKPSWLVPYDELSEPDKEADRQIGRALFYAGREDVFETLRYCEAKWSEERGTMIDQIQALRDQRKYAVEEVIQASDQARDGAVAFIFDALSKALGLDGYVVEDGSETWDGDVYATLMRILYDAKVLDPEDNSRSRSPSPTSVPDGQEAVAVSLARHVKADLAAAHAEICRLQGIDPATHSWPVWSSQAHTIAWCDRIIAEATAAPSDREWILEAWQVILDERFRQMREEGWTLEHDDQHTSGEMLTAAVLYLHYGTPLAGQAIREDGAAPAGWPWDAEWWKPKDRERNLVRAGALCLAEHDRLVRAGRLSGPADHKLGLCLRNLADLRKMGAGR